MKVKNSLLKMTGLIAIVFATACSTQWREADAGLSSEQIVDMLSEAGAANAQSASLIQSIDADDSSVYFAEAPGTLGTVASVMSLAYFNFLGKGDDYTFRNISYVRLFFLDQPSGGSRSNALIVGIREGSSTALTYYNFSGAGTIDGDQFEAILKNPSTGKVLVLRSWDVEDDGFKNVIQLRVSDVDAQGYERYIGKFSTLVGYGG